MSEKQAYVVPDDAESARKEKIRHGLLAAIADPASIRALERIGVAKGARCLDVGTGGASLARWLAERVGPAGSVLATDVDLRFAETGGFTNLELRRHDVVKDELPADAFDLVHARGLLQHLDRREEVIDKLIAATRPGGRVLFEDVDWLLFDQQPIPEPFASLARLARRHNESQRGYDGTLGRRYLPVLQGRGLEEVEAAGHVFTMQGGTPTLEWFVLALDWAKASLVAAGVFTAAFVDEALAQARRPEFKLLSPVLLSAWGRKPRAR
jgi:SAM-dependent methyltransferase